MNKRIVGVVASIACCSAGTATAASAAEPESNVEMLRRLIVTMGVTFKEESEGMHTEFVFHLSKDEDSEEEYRCTATVDEGDFYAHCLAVLPLTIPSNRLDVVAERLAFWNGERSCGRFGLDFERREAFFVSEIPVAALRKDDPLLTLTFFGMPMLLLAEKAASIRAAVDGAPLPVRQVSESDETGTVPEADRAGFGSDAVATTFGEPEEPVAAERGEVDAPVEDHVLAWIRARGVEPDVSSDSNGTAFQFPVGLAPESGLFLDATAQIHVMAHWVSVSVSPNIRFPEAVRSTIAKTLLILSDAEDGSTFLWMPEDRLAVRAVLPDILVDGPASHALTALLIRVGLALNRHSAELLSALVSGGTKTDDAGAVLSEKNGGCEADFSGAIPRHWPFCSPFDNGDMEMQTGFLVVDQVESCHAADCAGIEPGDILLSCGTDLPAPEKNLVDAWLAFLLCKGDNPRGNPGKRCWFARCRNGKTDVYALDWDSLYVCGASLGTCFVRFKPQPFGKGECDLLARICSQIELPPGAEDVKLFFPDAGSLLQERP